MARDDLLIDYLSFLKARNGTTDPSVAYPNREDWLARADASPVRHRGRLDPATEDKAFLALLSFVKANAAEAYGVEFVSARRRMGPATGEPFDEVHRAVIKEETYHTRILAGAAIHFGLPKPQGAWAPLFRSRC